MNPQAPSYYYSPFPHVPLSQWLAFWHAKSFKATESQHVDVRVQLADDNGGWEYVLLEKVGMPVTMEKLSALLFETKCNGFHPIYATHDLTFSLVATSRYHTPLHGAWDIALDRSAYEVQVTDAKSSYDLERGTGTLNMHVFALIVFGGLTRVLSLEINHFCTTKCVHRLVHEGDLPPCLRPRWKNTSEFVQAPHMLAL